MTDNQTPQPVDELDEILKVFIAYNPTRHYNYGEWQKGLDFAVIRLKTVIDAELQASFKDGENQLGEKS